MASRILILILASTVSNAAEFPAICPDKNNLEQVCKHIKEIDPRKTLVFQDGTEMPACFIKTRLSTLPKIRDKYKNHSVFLMSKLTSRTPKLTNEQIGQAIRSPASMISQLPELSKELTTFQNLTNDLELFPALAKVPPVNISDEFQIAKTNIQNLLSSQEQLKKQVNQVKLRNYEFNPEFRECEADLRAFYQPESQHVEFSINQRYLPRNTRIFIMGHEIGHSMSSCTYNIETGTESPFFSKLVTCFQNEVGKFKRYFPFVCDTHKSEAFCDHLGVHALETELRNKPQTSIDLTEAKSNPNKIVMPPGYDSIFLLLDSACNQGAKSWDSYRDHASSARRLHDIVLRNPTIAKSVNCPVDPQHAYCDVEKGLLKPASHSTGNPTQNRQ